MTKIDDVELSLWLSDKDLSEGDLLDISSVYGMVLMNHEDLVALAVAYRKPLAVVYWECKKAQNLIAERVRMMKRNPVAVKRQEMG